ncbi:hypothetical protein EBT25_04525 [bacterium]|jgi:hypothetical protein|nr:hypothetical protein [bacterium]
MTTANEPVEAIAKWQEWYRKHRVVPEINAPLVTQDSGTLDASNNLLTDYCTTMSFEKAKEYFADTLAEFANELSGKELYKAFYAAAMDNMDCAEKEYNKAKQLVDMLRHNNVAP